LRVALDGVAAMGRATAARWKTLPAGLLLVGIVIGAASAAEETLPPICGAPGSAIPDQGSTTDSIIVGEPTGMIVDVDVFLDISHTSIGDLRVTLDHSGSAAGETIINRPGSDGYTIGCRSDDILATVDDEAGLNAETMCFAASPAIRDAVVGGDPIDNTLLRAFDGPDGLGTWTLTVSDNARLDTGALNEWCVILTVSTNSPPNCRAATPSVASLWPPDHEFHDIDVLGVTDPDGDPLTIVINSIFQDELVDEGGDSLAPDGEGVGDAFASLRAERAGKGTGRVYYVGLTADDGQGGTCTGSVRVTVPKSNGKKAGAIDEGPLFDSTAL